jgi:hypothetical protein
MFCLGADFIKLSSAVCGIKPTNNVLLYRTTTLTMSGLALLFFALRIIATIKLRLGWALDDAMAIASVVRQHYTRIDEDDTDVQ